MKYIKYQFATKEEFRTLIVQEGLAEINEGVIKYIGCTVVEGVIIMDAENVLNTSYSVDIIFDDNEPLGLKSFEVYPSGIGQHIIAGKESMYLETKN